MPSLNVRIDASTLRFALLGGALPHTWSPQIHNSLFDACALNASTFRCPLWMALRCHRRSTCCARASPAST